MELEIHKRGSFENPTLKLLQEESQGHSNLFPFWTALCEVQARGEEGQKETWEMGKVNYEQILKMIHLMS